MYSLFFWKAWPPFYRRIWFGLSIIFVFSLMFMWFSWVRGANGIIDWEKIQQQKIIETTTHSFRVGPFELHVPAESYVIFEYFQGSHPHHNVVASYIFLAVLIVCAMMLLAIITSLDRFWFLAGMGLFILFIASLRLDALLIFGIRGYPIPIAVMLVFVVVCYYYNSIRPATPFVTRLAVLLLIAFGTGLIASFFSQIEYPLLQLAVTAYWPSLALTILFILMVAHEIMVSFVYIASQGSSRSFMHFTIISFIYLINILITSLHETGYLKWDFVYINLYLLLSTSALLGVWGFKLRESLYENIFPFTPFGGFFYLAFGSICFVTLSQLLGNANDSTLIVIREVIIFSHAGFGIIFLTYVFSNFGAMLANNMQAHRILYKPNRMPYFTFQFAGLIATLAFVFYSGWRNYTYNTLAGFYNYIADLYALRDDETLARTFYEQSRTYSFQSHRNNYALAALKAERLDFDRASYHYGYANSKRPTDFSLVNESNLFLWKQEFFPAIRSFNKAVAVKPSEVLYNNLGYTYSKVHTLDSAAFYMNAAREEKFTKSAAEANFFAMTAAEYLPVNVDSILRYFNSESPAVTANAIAAATLFNQEFSVSVRPLEQPRLDLYSATLLNNYIIRNAKTLDTTFVNRALAIASDSVNFSYSEALKASLAYAYYHQSNVTKALQLLGELAYTSESYKGKYNYIMGLWAMEQENPGIALTYFSYAVDADYKQARFYNAIALTEDRQVAEANIAWDSISNGTDIAQKQIAAQIKKILNSNPTEALTYSDADKYQYCRYKVSFHDSVTLTRLLNTFQQSEYKAQVLLDASKKALQADRISSAMNFLNAISGLELADNQLYRQIQRFELRLMAAQGRVDDLKNQVAKINLLDGPVVERLLYEAMINEASNQRQVAEKNYELLATMNPFFEDGVLAAAKFFRNQDLKSSKAYDILAEAIHVNHNSIRLLKAYAAEASRLGYDEYASSALQRLMLLEESIR